MKNPQAPSSVIMIRPHYFSPNPETASDNAFQSKEGQYDAKEIAQKAYNEVTAAAQTLEQHGIRVHLFDDETTLTPDSVFPNNWFSTHAGGHVALYPMYAKNRRLERRYDIIELLKSRYRVQDVIDYSGLEYDGLYLEGTGAMVIDHLERVVYAIQSNRTNPVLLERFCTHFNFEPMVFNAQDPLGADIYHTNVLMCIATDFVMIGLDMIKNSARRAEIVERLEQSDRDVIDLSPEQISEFAGNAIELSGASGRVLVLSKRAKASLTPDQLQRIEKSCEVLALDVGTLELAGGSIRCMLAGVHLSRREFK